MNAQSALPARRTLSGAIAAEAHDALSALLLTALAVAAGEGRTVSPASFGAEFTATSLMAQPVSVEAWVERATRTLVFVAAEARGIDGGRLAAASAVFRVLV